MDFIFLNFIFGLVYASCALDQKRGQYLKCKETRGSIRQETLNLNCDPFKSAGAEKLLRSAVYFSDCSAVLTPARAALPAPQRGGFAPGPALSLVLTGRGLPAPPPSQRGACPARGILPPGQIPPGSHATGHRTPFQRLNAWEQAFPFLKNF